MAQVAPVDGVAAMLQANSATAAAARQPRSTRVCIRSSLREGRRAGGPCASYTNVTRAACCLGWANDEEPWPSPRNIVRPLERTTGIKGVITKEQAAVHPYRGRISRCLGHGRSKGVPDINAGIIEAGDNILLCSDGLSDVVPNDEMHSIITQHHPQEATRRLVNAANRHGGPDNISAVLLRRVI